VWHNSTYHRIKITIGSLVFVKHASRFAGRNNFTNIVKKSREMCDEIKTKVKASYQKWKISILLVVLSAIVANIEKPNRVIIFV